MSNPTAKTAADARRELGAEGRMAAFEMVMGYRVVPAPQHGISEAYARMATAAGAQKGASPTATSGATDVLNATLLHYCVVDGADKPLMPYGDWLNLIRDGYGAKTAKLCDVANRLTKTIDEEVEAAKNGSGADGTDAQSAPASNLASDTPSEEAPHTP